MGLISNYRMRLQLKRQSYSNVSTSESADITGISATYICYLAEMLQVKSKIRTSLAEVTCPVVQFMFINVKMWHLVFLWH